MIIDIKNLRLGNFIKNIMYNPFPLEGQRCMGPKEELFTEDMVTIEMAKYFYIGEEAYREDPIPRRLACTTAFSVERIIDECRKKAKLVGEAITAKSSSPNGLVLHVRGIGRGLDLLLLTENHGWNWIYVHDEDERYEGFLWQFFPRFPFYSAEEDRPVIKDEKGGMEYVFESPRLCK